ncbi:hypothetical protein DERP_015054 [Dermatophagoides pteronyssinus]|nr:hypothetical protein DERP_015054 [Dermatophagoides pteronyssinus]
MKLNKMIQNNVPMPALFVHQFYNFNSTIYLSGKTKQNKKHFIRNIISSPSCNDIRRINIVVDEIASVQQLYALSIEVDF